jgi:hypothetical protein
MTRQSPTTPLPLKVTLAKALSPYSRPTRIPRSSRKHRHSLLSKPPTYLLSSHRSLTCLPTSHHSSRSSNLFSNNNSPCFNPRFSHSFNHSSSTHRPTLYPSSNPLQSRHNRKCHNLNPLRSHHNRKRPLNSLRSNLNSTLLSPSNFSTRHQTSLLMAKTSNPPHHPKKYTSFLNGASPP